MMKVDDITRVACVGAGVIGSSWTTQYAMKGLNVNVYDVDEAQLDKAKEYVKNNIAYLLEKELVTPEVAAGIPEKITYSTDPAACFSGVQFIQESGPEKYEIKQSMLATIEQYAAEDAIIASSTSGLKMTEIARNAVHPERCIVGHPYNPPHLIPLVDVCKGEKTSDEFARLAYDFYKSIGKEPVLLNKEVPGFVANRMQAALYREMVDLVENGVCSVEDADKALVFGPGIRWGLMGMSLLLQLSGGDAGYEGCVNHLVDSWNMWLEDMADWKAFPEDMPTKFQQGVNEEKAHRDPALGQTDAEICRWRDDCLIDILKMHNKF